MTYYCAECDTHWAPYQARDRCPECGTGTKRYAHRSPDEGTAARHKAALAERQAMDEHARRVSEFEDYYTEREVRLNGLDLLPVAEPTRREAA